MDLLVLYLPAVLVGWGITWGLVRFAPRFGAVVLPNPRSSHSCPTPTLGGLGLIAGMWVGLGVAATSGFVVLVDWKSLACTLVVLLFCADGFKPLRPLEKLAIQVSAGLLLVFSGAVLTRISLPPLVNLELGSFAIPFTLLWYVALQNLYDFMDGIDGLAGLEGVLVALCFAGIALEWAPDLAWVAMALAGGITGFLFLNRPPGKIFMGDVGGQSIGLIFALLAVLGERAGIPLGLMLLFLGAFLFDSVYTLVRRLLRGENISHAHRLHLYQRLVRMGWSHASVDATYGSVTVILGLSGYLLIEDHLAAAGLVFCLAAGVMVGGTVWLEARWAKRNLENETGE